MPLLCSDYREKKKKIQLLCFTFHLEYSSVLVKIINISQICCLLTYHNTPINMQTSYIIQNVIYLEPMWFLIKKH